MDQLVTTGTADLPPQEGMQVTLERTCAFWYPERALLRRPFATAYAEPAVAELLERREGWRWTQLARVAQPWASGLSLEEAAGVLTVHSSFPAYDRLGADEQHPEVAARLLDHLARYVHQVP